SRDVFRRWTRRPTRPPPCPYPTLFRSSSLLRRGALGDLPEIDVSGAPSRSEGHHLVGLPSAHVVPMADDPGPGPKLPGQLRPQLQVEGRREEQHHDRRTRQVGLEQVLLAKFDALTDASVARVLSAVLDAVWIDVHADAARAAVPRGGD